MNTITIVGLLLFAIFIFGIRIIQQTTRGLVETFGKFSRYANPGFQWIIPIIQKMRYINITEQMVDAQPQEIITKDKLNAVVDAQVYWKVNDNEKSVYNSQYNVNNYRRQIVQLMRTTLRNIIGGLTLTEANSERNKINQELHNALSKKATHWGVDVIRTELKEITPPEDVQQAMNKVVTAENEKISAKDYATATETKADGEKRASIKMAEGSKRSIILEAEARREQLILDAEGTAKAIKLEADAKANAIEVVNNSTEKTFTDKAQILRKLEAVEKSLMHNTKIVIPEGESLVNIIGDAGGITPLPTTKGRRGK